MQSEIPTNTQNSGTVDFGPYLYDLQSDSVYVMATTTAPDDTLSIVLKDNTGNEINTYHNSIGVRNTMTDYNAEYGERYTYKVLLQNLTANTIYKYASTICGISFNDNTFKTPPPLGDQTTEFKFGVWGDTQDVPLCTKAAPDILSFKPLAMLHVGDFLNNGQNPSQLNKYLFGPASELLRNTSIITSAGNHDRGVSYWKDVFPTPRTNTSSFAGNLYYSYDIGNIHFVVIHLWLGLNKEYKQLCLYNDDLDVVSGDVYRVKKMLEEDAASPAATSAKYRIVTMHGPPADNPDWDCLVPYIKKYDPSIIFFGHKHIYKYFTISGTEFKAIVTGLIWDGSTYQQALPSFVEATANHYDTDTGKYVLKLKPHVWNGSSDADTGAFNVRPGDVIISPPNITSRPVVITTEDTATIMWDTDVATDERIDFGVNRYLTETRVTETELTGTELTELTGTCKHHTVIISNLIPGTTYYYRVKGIGENGDIGRSDIFTFETKNKK